MTEFEHGMSVLFAGPRSSDGTFIPAVGAPIPTRAIAKKVDVDQPIGFGGAQHPGFEILLQRAEVPLRPVAEKDRYVVADGALVGTYMVQAIHEDKQRLKWKLDCRRLSD